MTDTEDGVSLLPFMRKLNTAVTVKDVAASRRGDWV